MTVYIITQAYEGEIRGVFALKDDADAECRRINALDKQLPATVEEHQLQGVAGYRLDLLMGSRWPSHSVKILS